MALEAGHKRHEALAWGSGTLKLVLSHAQNLPTLTTPKAASVAKSTQRSPETR